MPINLNCPNCGQATELPDAAINRRARCTSCHSVYAVRDVVQGSSQPIPSQPVLAPDGSMSSRETLVVGLSISVFAILFLAFITYWFGYRDTWETDNYSNIIARCEAVIYASNSSDDDAATQAYNELTTFIGNRSIKTQSLATRIENADQAIAPILARLEQERRKREAKEQAEWQARKAERHAREARERSARRVRAQNEDRTGSAQVRTGIRSAVFAASTYEAFKRFEKLKIAGDHAGAKQMIRMGLVFAIESGTEVTVISQGFLYSEIRPKEGSSEGVACWVYNDSVRGGRLR